MEISDLVFIGIKGSVMALDRQTGEQVWATHLKSWDHVNVVLDGELVLASTVGEVFCLDAATGRGLWHNKLKGQGMGLVSIATLQSSTSGFQMTAMAEEIRRRRAAAHVP